MAQTIKSVLLFDHDSLVRALNQRGGGNGDLFGARVGAWLEALESGDLSTPREEGVRRRYVTKRCYADPKVLGKNRPWMAANGVQVVETAPVPGFVRGAAETAMALDALDMLATHPDEIILLSGEADFGPLLPRLREGARRVVIYAREQTPPSYRALADAAVEETLLLRVLIRQTDAVGDALGEIPRPPRMRPPIAAAAPEPATLPAVRAASRPVASVDREALAALVRRIHDATQVPLFSPTTFADLFRLLVEEVARSGYKFQATADRVADGLNALGREVTKRQVGFVIKGLALRGHVFNPADVPDVLAEQFFEQVLFLADGAELGLTGEERELVRAWVMGSNSDEAATDEEDDTPAPRPARPAAVAAPRRAEPARPAPAPARTERVAVPPPPRFPSSGAQLPRRDPAQRAAPRPAEPAEPARSARPVRMGEQAEGKPRPAAPAARPAPAAPRPRAETPPAAVTPPAPPPRAEPPAPAPAARNEIDLENSILAAIADAVDVLIQPRPAGGAPAGPPADPRAGGGEDDGRPARSSRAAPAPPPPVEEGDEIGDEIQRILASYKQKR